MLSGFHNYAYGWSYHRDMRSTPIGTRRPAYSRDVPRRKPLRPEPTPLRTPADLYPVDVRSSIGPRGTYDRFARMVITDEFIYIASSRNKGKKLDKVTRYPRPAGEPVQTAAKRGNWGPFSWSGCGCGNSWGIHTRAKLIDIGNASAADA